MKPSQQSSHRVRLAAAAAAFRSSSPPLPTEVVLWLPHAIEAAAFAYAHNPPKEA